LSNIDLSQPPYRDRFDPDVNRTKVLFQPDHFLQQAELTELQSIAEHNIKRLGDSMFEDGSIQTGMAFNIDSENGKLIVEGGLIYLEGKVRQFKEKSVDFTGQGTEKIGVKVHESIITPDDDPSLLDQTVGAKSQLSEGADRLKEDVQLVVNDESAPTIYEFRDGQLFLDPNKPNYSALETVLAERTHEESGSYQVEGFDMWTEQGPTEDKINIVIDSGVAYVLGYRIDKPTPTRVPVSKANDFTSVVQESYYYSSSNQKIRISSNSVKEVTQVVTRSQTPSGGIQISKGSSGGRDVIPQQYTNIDRETPQIWTGSSSSSTTYTYGTDYTIVQESGIQYVDWDTGSGGSEPALGTSYNLSFEYDNQAEEGTDYIINVESRNDNVPGWDTYVNFTDMPGVKPMENGMVNVNYDFYLAREDIVTLNGIGEFTVMSGQPARPEFVSPPVHSDPFTLKIGNVFLYPNSEHSISENTGTVRLRMEDLQSIKNRLEDVEYNQVVQQLESQGVNREDPVLLRGVFADSFVDFSRMDLEASSVAVDFNRASITTMEDMPSSNTAEPMLDYENTTASVWGSIATAPYTEVEEVSQPLATGSMNVNPYNVYNKMGVLDLDPQKSNWINTERIVVENTDVVRKEQINDYVYANTRGGEVNIKENSDKHSDWFWTIDNENWVGIEQEITNTEQDVNTNVSSRIVNEETMQYMPSVQISFRAENLTPNTDNLVLTFDNEQVSVESLSVGAQGTQPDTVRANSSGIVEGSFIIPEEVRTGKKEVILRNDTNVASTTFTGEGLKQLVEVNKEKTFFVTDIVTPYRITAQEDELDDFFNIPNNPFHTTSVVVDPLAQSFVLPYDRVVTSFDLYFSSKSSTNNVIVQVRGLTDGGLPNNTVHSEVTLTPNQVNVSGDASTPTNVTLKEPLLCTANSPYVIVILTDNSEYRMWTATLGETLIGNENESVSVQPYTDGVLFSSSNAQTWTTHQGSDLKFAVYSANFESGGSVEFNEIDGLDSDTMTLLATTLTPDNTKLTWESKTVPLDSSDSVSMSDIPWEPLTSNQEVDVNPAIGRAKLRATFESTNSLSPMLRLDDLLFLNHITRTEGSYESRNISAEEAPFNTLTIAYETDLPQGTSILPQYSLDAGQSWNDLTVQPETTRVSARYMRYTYSETISPEATNTQIKFRLQLNSGTRYAQLHVRNFVATFKEEV